MKEYEMSKGQLTKLQDACKPVAMIALHCGTPTSPQENANNAWKSLGKELGFDYMTVQPINGKGPEFFSANPIKEDYES